MGIINDKLKEIEKIQRSLESKISDLMINTEEKVTPPYTKSGGVISRSLNHPTDIKTRLNNLYGGCIFWNDTELQFPAYGRSVDIPTKGYNKHAHSRYSGGALPIDVIEFVEYDWGSIVNKHSQQFMTPFPKIKKTTNTKGEAVFKIGALDLVFNADGGYDENYKPIGTWGVTTYGVDIERTYFIKRDENGDIELDENGEEKKAPLYNADATKTSILWDKNGKCWRFYGVYAPGFPNT